MANEATLVVSDPSNPHLVGISYEVNANINVAEGTFMKLLDNRSASMSIVAGDPCAGIALADKTTGIEDTSTRLALAKDGNWRVYASNSITTGDALALAGYNFVLSVQASSSFTNAPYVIGYAEESATSGSLFEMRLKL